MRLRPVWTSQLPPRAASVPASGSFAKSCTLETRLRCGGTISRPETSPKHPTCITRTHLTPVLDEHDEQVWYNYLQIPLKAGVQRLRGLNLPPLCPVWSCRQRSGLIDDIFRIRRHGGDQLPRIRTVLGRECQHTLVILLQRSTDIHIQGLKGNHSRSLPPSIELLEALTSPMAQTRRELKVTKPLEHRSENSN